jgi:uncharacterized membrane protein YebE (DUF533 family)
MNLLRTSICHIMARMDTRQLVELLTRNPAAGAAVGGLAGSLLGNVLGGRGGGKKMLKYGGLAAVGYIAYQAWQKNQAQKAAGAAPGGGAHPSGSALGGFGAPLLSAAARPSLPASFDLETPANASNAMRVVQAMIAAAKADGVVDAIERDRVFQRVREAGLSQPDQDEVLRLLTQPMDMESVVRDVDSRELALEIYTASVFVVSPASRAERAYLDLLAARLGLESDLTMQVEQGVEQMARSVASP